MGFNGGVAGKEYLAGQFVRKSCMKSISFFTLTII